VTAGYGRAFPLRPVRSLAETAHRRGIEHGLDAAADSACRFWLLGPDRIEHLHDEPCIDRRDGEFTQSGIDVGCERVAPLLPVLGVAPGSFIPPDVFLGDFTEGAAFRGGEALRRPLSDLCVERVYPIVTLPAVRCGLHARLGERDIGVGSKPHVAALAVELEAEDP